MNYSDYYLTESERYSIAYSEIHNPTYASKKDYYKGAQIWKQRDLLNLFSTADNTFDDLINEHYSLEFSPNYANGRLAKMPRIANEFYYRHINTVKQLLAGYLDAEIRSKGAMLLIDVCLFGIVSYCTTINKIDSNTNLREFIKSTDAINNIALCKQVCTLLNEIAIDSSIKHKIERSADIIIDAAGKIELFIAAQNSSYYKKVYKAAYPNMKDDGLLSIFSRVFRGT